MALTFSHYQVQLLTTHPPKWRWLLSLSKPLFHISGREYSYSLIVTGRFLLRGPQMAVPHIADPRLLGNTQTDHTNTLTWQALTSSILAQSITAAPTTSRCISRPTRQEKLHAGLAKLWGRKSGLAQGPEDGSIASRLFAGQNRGPRRFDPHSALVRRQPTRPFASC